MTENSSGDPLDAHAQSLEDALAQSQQQERDEIKADMARQQSADDRIVRALTQE